LSFTASETVEPTLVNPREALELYFQDEPLPADVQSPMIAPVEISVQSSADPRSGGRRGACFRRVEFATRRQRGAIASCATRTVGGRLCRSAVKWRRALDPEAGCLSEDQLRDLL
jgi:hypothetical protein